MGFVSLCLPLLDLTGTYARQLVDELVVLNQKLVNFQPSVTVSLFQLTETILYIRVSFSTAAKGSKQSHSLSKQTYTNYVTKFMVIFKQHVQY